MPTTTTEEIETYLVDVPRSWLRNFTCEAICDDAQGYILGVSGDDEMLAHTATLLDKIANPVKTLTKVKRLALTWDELVTLSNHAEWYSYYWGEVEAGDAYDSGDMLAAIARGRGSLALAKRIEAEFFEPGLD